MEDIKIVARVLHKHKTEEQWASSTYIPKESEIIIYDTDSTHTIKRFKIGNGSDLAKDLPFSIVQGDWNQLNETAPDYIKNKPVLGTLASKSTVEKSDVASDIQTSLNKADTAIQSLDGYATESFVNIKVTENDLRVEDDGAGNVTFESGAPTGMVIADVQQTTGQSETAVMSQKAVTDCLESKVEKPTSVSSVSRLYGVGPNSKDILFFQALTSKAYKNSIPKRGDNGTFAVGTPTNPTDAVNKEYVDGIFKLSFLGSVNLSDQEEYVFPNDARIISVACRRGYVELHGPDGEMEIYSPNPDYEYSQVPYGTVAAIGNIIIWQSGSIQYITPEYSVLNSVNNTKFYATNSITQNTAASSFSILSGNDNTIVDIYVGR